MKLKSTQIKLIVLFLFNLCLLKGLYAQYCSPTFPNGCFNWRNQEIILGSINWTEGSNCSDSDFTSLSATLIAGTSYPMTVTNGVWCGCAVWVDMNQDDTFDASENLYYNYVGGDPSYTYNFNITIPSSVPPGSYRMRIVSGWGSDGVTVGGNGYGPCGSYQWGNFDDFTVNVIAPLGVNDITNASSLYLKASPNPVTNTLTVVMKSFKSNEAHLRITDMTGKLIKSMPVYQDREDLDVSSLAKGVYILNYSDDFTSQNFRFQK